MLYSLHQRLLCQSASLLHSHPSNTITYKKDCPAFILPTAVSSIPFVMVIIPPLKAIKLAFAYLTEVCIFTFKASRTHVGFPGDSVVKKKKKKKKNLPAMQETQIQSLGQEGTLEEETAMHSSIPA